MNPSPFSRRHFLLGSAASLAYLSSPSWSEEAATGSWQKFKLPPTGSGLVLQPRWVALKDRVTLFWAGTNAEARAPEVMFCSARDGDDDWSKVRAPFFGNDLGRVRRLAVAVARDAMGLVFQRETTQGNGAVEVHLSISYDNGYSFSNPFVMDSYVLGREGGSSVSIGARQGTRRPEFAAAWVAEDGVVRAANIDPRSGFRPQAAVVGNVENIHGKVEVVGAGDEGFYVVWPEAKHLKMARIKPLTGGIESTANIAAGDYARNFGVTSYYRGPAFLASATERGDFKVYQFKDQKANPISTGKFPLPGPKLDSRIALEDEKFLHLVAVDPGKQPKIFYTNNQSGSWSPPETICPLEAEVPVTGFDIVTTHNYAWVIVSQNQLLNIYRRKIR